MFTLSFKPKPVLMGLVIGCLFILVLVEWASLKSDQSYGQWTIRRYKESTAVLMHAEDIWQNKRSTLKTFDPFACTDQYKKEWLNSWHEVTCLAQDDKGQDWKYVARFGKRSNLLISWLPFIKDTRPAREMIKVDAFSPTGTDTK